MAAIFVALVRQSWEYRPVRQFPDAYSFACREKCYRVDRAVDYLIRRFKRAGKSIPY